MQELADIELLREYAVRNSEEAFAILAKRHVNLVYSAALRKTNNVHAAEEITQAVFIILAQKAGSLRDGTILSAWLYQTTRFATANYLRTETRRVHREQEAYMQSAGNEPEIDVWPQIAPHFEDAMGTLGEKDRSAIALRFFEGKSFRDVGQACGVTENAAKKRVDYAVAKLRKFLLKRGIVSSASIIVGMVSAHSVQAAPGGLAASVSAVATTKGAVATGSTGALVKGAFEGMAWAKAKLAIAVIAAVVVVVGGTAVVINRVTAPESFWLDAKFDSYTGTFSTNVPQIVLIRPTQFGATNITQTVGGEKVIGINLAVLDMLYSAYGVDRLYRTEYPADLPKERYDYLANLPVGSARALQEELTRKFGITGHHEARVKDVLLLKRVKTDAPGLKSADNGHPEFAPEVYKAGKIVFHHGTMRWFVQFLELKMNQPVIDQTGLTNDYDLKLEWDAPDEASQPDRIKQAVLNQLGLELVPSREPIDTLIFERRK